MRWLVEVSAIGKADQQSFCVDADSWQHALQLVRTHRGEIGPMNGFSIELLEEGYRAVDPVARARFAVKRAPDDRPLTEPVLTGDTKPSAQAESGAPPSGPAKPGAIGSTPPGSAQDRPASSATRRDEPAAAPRAATKRSSDKPASAPASVRPGASTLVLGSIAGAKPAPVASKPAAPAPAPVASKPAAPAPAPGSPKATAPSPAHSPPRPSGGGSPASTRPAAGQPPKSTPAVTVQPSGNVGSVGDTGSRAAQPDSSLAATVETPVVKPPQALPAEPAPARAVGSALPGLPALKILSRREEEPSAVTPLTYREYAFLVPEGTNEGLAVSVLLGQLELVQAGLATSRAGKLVNLAVFDVEFAGKRPGPPLATLSWKDWRGEPVVSFPRRASLVPPKPASIPAGKPASAPPGNAAPKPASVPAAKPSSIPSVKAAAASAKPTLSQPAITLEDTKPVRPSGAPPPPRTDGPSLILSEPSAQPRVAPTEPRAPAPRESELKAKSEPKSEPKSEIEDAKTEEIPALALGSMSPGGATPGNGDAPAAAPMPAQPALQAQAPAKGPTPAGPAVAEQPAAPVPPPEETPLQLAPAMPNLVISAKSEPPPTKPPSVAPAPISPTPPDVLHVERAPDFTPPPPEAGRPAGHRSSQRIQAARLAGRAQGDELISMLFESMHDLHFLRDALEGAEFCLGLAQELIPSRAGLTHFHDVERREFVLVRAHGEGTAELIGKRHLEGETLLAAAVKKRRAFVAEARDAMTSRYLVIGGAKSVVLAPVLVASRALAVIELVNPSDGAPFTQAEANAMNYIAEQFGEFLSTRGLVFEEKRTGRARA